MNISFGFVIEAFVDRPAEAVTLFDIHPERRGDLSEPGQLTAVGLAAGEPVEMSARSTDGFGNIRRHWRLPAGGARFEAEGAAYDPGFPGEEAPAAVPLPRPALPADVAAFLDDSPLCPPGPHAALAGTIAAGLESGRARVEAIRVFAARSGPQEGVHLAIALCRAAGIPARFCTGYGVAATAEAEPQAGFDVWWEAHLAGRWFAFDLGLSPARTARLLVARGRDAGDVPPVASDVPVTLRLFLTHAEEGAGPRFPASTADRRRHWTALRSIRRS